MRKIMAFASLSAVVIATVFITRTRSENSNTPLSKQDRIDLAIQQEYELTKDPSTGVVPKEKLIQATAYRDALLAAPFARGSASVPGISWQERGPNNIGGRTRALLFDLNDAANGYKKVWAGSVGGGLWFTNDITASTPVWNKVNDMMENLAISAIVQNPANPQEMYVGTGEGWFNSDAIKGLGIWKSTNGGASWTRLLSTATFAFINDLLIDNNGRLYASVRQATTADASGIQKSSDGGATWTQVLGSPVFGSSARGGDLELAANGDIYASLGTTGSNGGIYISDFTTNAGNTGNTGTWTNVTPNASGVITTPASLWQRIELATAPSNSNIVYALFQGAGSSNCTSIQQFNKASNSWSVKTVPTIIDQGSNSNFTRGQAWYDMIAAVDPNNADVLYIGGVDALRSDNGGTTWTQMTTWSLFAATGFSTAQNVHADHHAIVYAPGNSGKALWGTDGGVHYTTNANIATGKPLFESKNIGYNVTQYYGCAIHPTNTDYFLAGAQDNGTQKFTTAGMNTTTQASGGDGAFCHIDQDNPNVQITSYVYNNYYISTNGGVSFASKSFFNTGSFINPTDYDDAANLLYGGNTAGTYFRWNDPSTGGSSTNNVSCAAFSGSSVTHVLVSQTVPNRVFFGLSNGSVVMVDGANAGTTATGTVIRTGTGAVSGIAIDPLNEAHMLVTYSNYGVTSIFESTNANSAGATWTAAEGNLPDMPVRWVMFDPRNSDWALIATELGVWSTDNINGGTTDWQPTNSGLANVRVDMLQYRPSDRTIAAATHGRGLFTTVVPFAGGPTPYIDFATASTAITETAAGVVNNCRKYKDYSVNVTTSATVTGDATISYAVQAGSTATAGVDYDVTANGDFTNSSLTHVFTSGAATSKALTIRIYDDAEIEGTETFTIKFTKSGTTNAVVRDDVHTVTITDNDLAVTTATAVAASGTQKEYLAGNTEQYFYSSTGEIIARIKNLSGHNYGCTDVTIDRTGTGAIAFWNARPTNFLMTKTITAKPTTNSASGRYEITLYFTAAEKASWEATTGRKWSDAMLIKVPTAISDGANIPASAVEVVTPVRGTFGTGYTLTYTFQSGFSGFGVGVPGTASAEPVIFPNPFTNSLKVRFPVAITGPAIVTLYDLNGKRVYRNTVIGNSVTPLSIDINNLGVLNRAIYLLDVYAGDKHYSFKVRKD